MGTENLGFIEALKVLTLGRIASAAFGVGLGRAALGEALRYTANRMQGDAAITRHQFVRFTLADPWSVLLLDDARVIHESTPIQPVDAAASAYRDTLVVTLRRDGFQGPQAMLHP